MDAPPNDARHLADSSRYPLALTDSAGGSVPLGCSEAVFRRYSWLVRRASMASRGKQGLVSMIGFLGIGDGSAALTESFSYPWLD